MIKIIDIKITQIHKHANHSEMYFFDLYLFCIVLKTFTAFLLPLLWNGTHPFPFLRSLILLSVPILSTLLNVDAFLKMYVTLQRGEPQWIWEWERQFPHTPIQHRVDL